MAAAYQTGAATGSIDLLQKLVSFLTAQGWTSNMSATDAAGWRAHLNKGSLYINLRAFTSSDSAANLFPSSAAPTFGILFYLGTGYSGASNWKSQAGGPQNQTPATIGSSVLLYQNLVAKYYFFDDGADNIVAAIETAAGNFQHMLFGPTLIKAGSWTGGMYFGGPLPGYAMTQTSGKPGYDTSSGLPFRQGGDFSTSPSGAASFVRVDADAVTGKWGANNQVTAVAQYTGLRIATGYDNNPSVAVPPLNYPYITPVLARSANAANGRTVMLPAQVFVERLTGAYSMIGDVPNIFIGFGNFASASIYSIGGENFMVFPTYVAGQYWFVRKKA